MSTTGFESTYLDPVVTHSVHLAKWHGNVLLDQFFQLSKASGFDLKIRGSYMEIKCNDSKKKFSFALSFTLLMRLLFDLHLRWS